MDFARVKRLAAFVSVDERFQLLPVFFALLDEFVYSHQHDPVRNVTVDDQSSKLSIDTPENILLDAEIAGFGSRCMAALMDYSILIVLVIIVSYLFGRAVPTERQNETAVITLLIFIQFLLITFYHLFFELAWNGQTPGKRRIGLRVIQSNGLPLTVSGAIIRNLVRLFDFMPILYGFGLIVLFATRNTQRLGDLAAKTVVIRERKQLTLTTLKENLSVQYWHIKPIDPLPYYIRIEHLTQDNRRTIVDYLRRRHELRDRETIVKMLAQQMVQKMDEYNLDLTITSNAARAERFLEQVARAFEVAEKTGD
jgi:uncharacterized RDD family membrane protein YckC